MTVVDPVLVVVVTDPEPVAAPEPLNKQPFAPIKRDRTTDMAAHTR